MRETYQAAWAGTARRLEEDAFGKRLELMTAESSDRGLIAFVAWTPSYDLHHCMNGGEIIDLFVHTAHRGRGVAVLLAAAVAGEILASGGEYLKGVSVNDRSVRRLYQKVAMRVSENDYVSGRAFRRLAELSGKSLREIAGGLPETAWNYEP